VQRHHGVHTGHEVPRFFCLEKIAKVRSPRLAHGRTGPRGLQNTPENVMVGENRGIEVMMSGADVERAFYAGEALGICRACSNSPSNTPGSAVQFGEPHRRLPAHSRPKSRTCTLTSKPDERFVTAPPCSPTRRKGRKGNRGAQALLGSIPLNAEMARPYRDQAVADSRRLRLHARIPCPALFEGRQNYSRSVQEPLRFDG